MKFRPAATTAAGLTMLGLATFVLLGQPARVAGRQAPTDGAAHAEHSAHAGKTGAGMSDAEMRRHADAYWATHPRVGAPATPEGGIAATFTVRDFRFDRDGNAGTQIDTARILLNETVQWTWIQGIHSVTNGENGEDENAGSLFNQASDSVNPTFTFTFTEVGTVPFFCVFHELQVMKGYVVVSPSTGVGPSGGGALGFTAEPAPNPTAAGATFAFAMREAGRVRAEVFDTRGRRIAEVLDRDFGAGAHSAAWDGRTASGAVARAGVYHLRLRLPGHTDTRAIVVKR